MCNLRLATCDVCHVSPSEIQLEILILPSLVPRNTQHAPASACVMVKSHIPKQHLIHNNSHLTPHTSHLTPHTSHLTPHTSHLTPHTSHLTPHTLHFKLAPMPNQLPCTSMREREELRLAVYASSTAATSVKLHASTPRTLILLSRISFTKPASHFKYHTSPELVMSTHRLVNRECSVITNAA
jgi:hypothetical protein